MVATPTVNKGLPPQTTVKVGETLNLGIEARPGEPNDELVYAWIRGDTSLNCNVANYEKLGFTKGDVGTYTVTITAKSNGESSAPVTSKCLVTEETSPPASPGTVNTPPTASLEWDSGFAKGVLATVAWVMAIGMLFLSYAAWITTDVARFVAYGLMVLALVLGMAGCALALLDLRGRARLAASFGPESRSLGGEAVKQIPDIIKNFGALGLSSAVLLLAAVAMVSAAVIGWGALPSADSSPASSATTETTTSTSTPSASSRVTGVSPTSNAVTTNPVHGG